MQRWTVCSEQEQKFQVTKNILKQKLAAEFDEIIYIGHARQGNGLGLGPFNDQYTLKIEDLFIQGARRLKRFIMATCNATENFKHLTESYGVEFVGGIQQKVTWEENLRTVQRYISSI